LRGPAVQWCCLRYHRKSRYTGNRYGGLPHRSAVGQYCPCKSDTNTEHRCTMCNSFVCGKHANKIVTILASLARWRWWETDSSFVFYNICVLLGKTESVAWRRSVKLVNFQNSDRRHLRFFFKFQKLDSITITGVNMRHRTKFSGDRWNGFWDTAIFYFSKWPPPPNFEILPVITMTRVSRRHRTKFRNHRSNRWWHMIFLFFKMAGAAILDF